MVFLPDLLGAAIEIHLQVVLKRSQESSSGDAFPLT
jgi:hypothetical protein